MLSNIFSSWFSLVTVPTHLTLLRILLVPCIVVSMMWHAWVEASIFFCIAAISDVLDGALARFLNKVTFLGSFLDPLADKMLLIASYAGLTFLVPSTTALPLWFLAFVLLTEAVLLGFSAYWGLIRKSMIIKPTRLGRMASFAQILFIGWLFFCIFSGAEPTGLFYLLLMLIVLARSCAFIDYGVIACSKNRG